ncbi:RNA polymerase factor sigma-54 [Schinkia azotoformans]|uniref:RNA polymerase factor sigma-54 n=1 Tax=Schinkia azotoformans TaxID=1454 RepID=UPI002DBA0146|nr:RNA polymerase factor sigma-54 [Schinkia azotoformans]MEC1718978.1 RNA polymerase factor sigma-54 [Schinkia azotoformans]MED4411992.1 RNA polymerase factor sigma-54 [Schinkia azotoformans]
MKQGLVQQQTTKLVMTNELRQAISLLQYSSAELDQFLQEQATENPLLSVESFRVESTRKKKKNSPSSGQPSAKMEQQESRMTIHDHLQKQIGLLKIGSEEKQIINYLILSIDKSGYFTGNIEEISNRFTVPASVIESLLGKIQECEPIGVGARNLQECLLIQLKNLPERNLLAEEVVANHLQMLADRKWKDIGAKLNVAIEQIQDVFDFIQMLDPRPASAFNEGVSNYIVPDMIIKKEQEDLAVSFNERLMPSIKVDSSYEPIIGQKDNEAYKYLREKMDQVHFLKRAFEQRLETMQKVMKAIIDRQRDFFLKDDAKLKPLTMRDIAQMIDVHESTVSRAVNGKYVQTSKGVFELKYFFTSTIQTEDFEDASSKEVKEAMKTIVDGENKKKPLSDQQIAAILKEKHGYNISRRTVAKYRDQLGILASSKRKRY